MPPNAALIGDGDGDGDGDKTASRAADDRPMRSRGQVGLPSALRL